MSFSVEEAIPEGLSFPPLLLSPDSWNEFQEKLEAHCGAIILWEGSIPDGKKDLNHYIKLFNLIDGLDCLNAFPLSIKADMERNARQMVLEKKRILMDRFKKRIEQKAEEEIRKDPAKSYLLAGMVESLEPQEMAKARAEYSEVNKKFYSFHTRPLKGMDDEAIGNLARLGLIETEEDIKGTYKTSSIIKIIVAVLEDQLGESVKNLNPEEKINLVKGILEHASARPEGADGLIDKIAKFEANENRESASRVIEDFLNEIRVRIHNATNNNLNALGNKDQSGWKAIKFLEEHMEEGPVKKYLITEIRTVMANPKKDPIGRTREKEKIQKKHLEEMIEKVGGVMGFTFEVSVMADDHFIATVSHKKQKIKPITLMVIISNVKNPSYSGTIQNGRSIAVIRLGEEFVPGEVYQAFAHELGHMYRGETRDPEDANPRPYASDGDWKELVSKFFELFYIKKATDQGGELLGIDINHILNTQHVAKLVLFRELCRNRIRSTSPLIINEIAQHPYLTPKIPHLSAELKPNLGKYIFGTIAAENGLRIMDQLKLEKQEEFLHEILRLFMNCRDRDLGEAYYELLAQWEADKAAA